jgi:cell division protein FtsB
MSSRGHDVAPRTGSGHLTLALTNLNETIVEQEVRMESLYAERGALEREIASLRPNPPWINGYH